MEEEARRVVTSTLMFPLVDKTLLRPTTSLLEAIENKMMDLAHTIPLPACLHRLIATKTNPVDTASRVKQLRSESICGSSASPFWSNVRNNPCL